jgi:hypothetical protein
LVEESSSVVEFLGEYSGGSACVASVVRSAALALATAADPLKPEVRGTRDAAASHGPEQRRYGGIDHWSMMGF